MKSEIINIGGHIERDREYGEYYCGTCEIRYMFSAAMAPSPGPCHPGRQLFSGQGSVFAFPLSYLDANGS